MSYPCESHVSPGSLACLPEHCAAFRQSSSWRAYCKCLDWQGRHIPGCIPKTPTDPIQTYVCFNKQTRQQLAVTFDQCLELRDRDPSWTWTDCFCCCSGSSDESTVEASETDSTAVDDVEVNDEIMGASTELADGKLLLSWRHCRVSFSEGITSADGTGDRIAIRYGTACQIAVPRDHLFLLHTGALKPARLITSEDLLVDATGAPVTVVSAEAVQCWGPIHYIGLGELALDGDMPLDGHLLLIGGLVSADYWIQIAQGSQELGRFLAPGARSQPRLQRPKSARSGGEKRRTHAGLQRRGRKQSRLRS